MPAPLVAAAKAFGLRKMLSYLGVLLAVGFGMMMIGGFLFVSLFSGPAAAIVPPAPAASVAPGAWIVPVNPGYSITSTYGYRANVTPHDHFGIDLATGCGVPVLAASSGVVTFAGWTTGGWGNRILIAHPDGTATGYAHLQTGSLSVNAGDPVTSGQNIALEGKTGIGTGCHLHFETFKNNVRVNPVPFMLERGVTF